MHSHILGLEDGGGSGDLELGRRREQTCTQLALRACDIAQEKSQLAASAADETDLSVLLRVMLEACMPHHGETPVLDSLLNHNLRLVRAIQSSGKEHIRDKDGATCLIYDAACALALNQAPLCGDHDLPGLGWADLPTIEFFLDLDPVAMLSAPREEMESLFIRLGLVGLRALCALQQSALLPPAEIQPTFARLGRLVDVSQALADALITFGTRPEQIASTVVRSWLPLELECAVFEQAKRQASTRSATVWMAAQRRFVHRLRAVSTSVAPFSDSSLTCHLAATLLSLLDTVSDWPQWAIAAADQHRRGEGVLAAAGFTVVDLATLYQTFAKASGIFATLGDRALELEEGMRRLARGDTGALVVSAASVAESMVKAALVEIGA